jgi:DNA invertase Pin-like site-specific DNA recombinase
MISDVTALPQGHETYVRKSQQNMRGTSKMEDTHTTQADQTGTPLNSEIWNRYIVGEIYLTQSKQRTTAAAAAAAAAGIEEGRDLWETRSREARPKAEDLAARLVALSRLD